MASGHPLRRYLALVFPMLAFERWRATRPHLSVADPDAPVALTETIGGCIRLTAVDQAAARAGLAVGEAAAAARARVADLVLRAADPHGDCDWLERLAEGLARYSPHIRLDPADGLTLDVTEAVNDPAGEARLAGDVVARMARRGLTLRHAFGDTPTVARALARFAGGAAPDEAGAVRRLPVAALELETDDTEALVAAGLRTVGDAAARPPAALAAQFGRETAEAVRRLTDRPTGWRAETHTPPGPDRQVDQALAPPIAEAKPVLAAIEAALVLLMQGLMAAKEGGCCWEARLFAADGQCHRLLVETDEPVQAVPPVLRLFAGRWAMVADRLAASGGCDLVRVRVVRGEAIGTGRLALEGGAAARPDRAAPIKRRSRRTAAAQPELDLFARDPVPSPAGPTRQPPPAPIHLFDPPQRLDSVAADPADGPPRRFRWDRAIHEIARAEGPERIATDAWRRVGGGPRDYFRIEDRRGRRLWIYREGEAARWYVHGLFA